MRNYSCIFNRLISLSLFIFISNHSHSQQIFSDSFFTKSDKRGVIIEKKDFNQGNIANPIQLIQGKVSGLSVSKPGGDPNRGFEIRLRGLSSINGNTIPLFVIDGVPVKTLDNLEPANIESITVLKNGSALYSEGGNSGVIIISTKKGKFSKPTIEYNAYSSLEQVARNLPSMSADEWRKLSKETGRGTDFGENTNWTREIEQNALSHAHNISMYGGTDKTSYKASLNYRSAQGVLKRTGYSQFNGRINLSQKAINDKLTLDLNMAATSRESEPGFTEAFKYAAISNPTSPVRSNNPAYEKYDGFFQQVLFDYYNPVSIIELDKNESKQRILDLSLKADFEIIRGLNFNALYATHNVNFLDGKYFDKNDYFVGMMRNGLASQTQDNSSDRVLQSSITYNVTLNGNIWIDATGGYFIQEFTNEGFYVQGGNFLTDSFSFHNLGAALDFKNGIGSVSSYKNSRKEIAFFGQINLNINNILSLTTGTRYEGSSVFTSAHKWALLPSAGITVKTAEFWRSDFFDLLNIRAGFTVSGNHPESYVNNPSSLDWEKKSEIEAGIDYSIRNSKFSGSFDFYSSVTSDLILSVMVAVPPNIYGQSLMNLGKLKSSGLEFTFNYTPIEKSDFSYTISLISSFNLENKFGSLEETINGSILKYGSRDLNEMGSPGQNQVPLARVEGNKPVGQLIAMVFKEIDANGYVQYADQNHNGYIDQADRQVVGNGLPKLLLGFGNVVRYKKWDLNVFFRSVVGHDLVNTYRALYEVPYMMSAYNLPNTASEMRNNNGKLLNSTSGMLTDLYVENASFISLDNFSLGYSFAVSEKSIRKLRIYVGGNNLFYISGYKGSDPNPRFADQNNLLVPGIDRISTWPRTRSVTFGANFIL